MTEFQELVADAVIFRIAMVVGVIGLLAILWLIFRQ